MSAMTVKQLISELEDCDPDSTVRFAIQPSYPFEHSIDRVEELFMEDGTDVVYLAEGGQVRFGGATGLAGFHNILVVALLILVLTASVWAAYGLGRREGGGGHMPDGLYQVTTRHLCAGFVVDGGRVTLCAPILRKRLAHWQTVAVPVRGPGPGGPGRKPPTPSWSYGFSD